MGDNLITLAKYKESQGISSPNEDTILNGIITRVSEFVKTYCRRTFIDYLYEDKIEISNGGSYSIMLQETPLVTIISVEYSQDYGQTYTALTEFTDWTKVGDEIFPIATREFPEGLNAYRITYNAGYEDIPADLEQAVIDLVTYYKKNDGTAHAVKFTNTSTMQIDYISDTALPAYIRRILDYYVQDWV